MHHHGGHHGGGGWRVVPPQALLEDEWDDAEEGACCPSCAQGAPCEGRPAGHGVEGAPCIYDDAVPGFPGHELEGVPSAVTRRW